MKWVYIAVSDEDWETLVKKDGEPHEYFILGDAAFELEDGEYWIDKFKVPVIRMDLEQADDWSERDW